MAPETSFKANLGPAVERMIEWMLEAKLDKLGPVSWSADVSMDLYKRLRRVRGRRDFSKECDDARLNGVILIQRLSANGISVIPVVELSDHKSLHRPLARAIAKKAAGSLGVAKDRAHVTMLAVDVERKDTRGYLAEGVPTPDLGPKIDHLWLFVRDDSGDLGAAFYANEAEKAGA